jgi:L-ribulose-5-phosphate 3-epimerase
MPISSRRDLLRATAGALAALSAFPAGATRRGAAASTARSSQAPVLAPAFRISLAQWSLHRSIFGDAIGDWERFRRALDTDPDSVLRGELDPLDFAAAARSLEIDGIEYVNTFFFGRARDRAYLERLRGRADEHGVKSLLIMCDNEGALGDPDEAARVQAVERHEKWLEAAAFLGCHAIRVNAQSSGSFEEQQRLAADGLRRLCEVAERYSIDVLVENHGGLSSHGRWLAGVMSMADHHRLGTLPDFGNFRLQGDEWYDRYQGVAELMPWARAVSAKSHDFDESGDETATDFRRMLRIVLDAGYSGWIGIEYEGRRLDEREGIRRTRDLLRRLAEELRSTGTSGP